MLNLIQSFLQTDPDLPAEQGEAFGCHVIAGLPPEPDLMAHAKPSAVLVPVILRARGATLLLTKRAQHLRHHAGQVAFPGGRIEPGESAQDAALREAEEEIGLVRDLVEPLGFLPVYYSGSGFRIHPLVARLDPDTHLTPSPDEVESVFEINLETALDLKNYRTSTLFYREKERRFFVLEDQNAYIWGVTAGILYNLATNYTRCCALK